MAIKGNRLLPAAISLRRLLAALVTTALIGCAAPVERPLPAFEGGFGCRGVGLGATIVGDPNATPPVWLVNPLDGQRWEATWPPGSYARFGDALEIVLADGSVFYREGDTVDGVCFTSDDGPWAIKYGRSGTSPQP